MQFGRDLKRRGQPWTDTTALELTPLAILRRQAVAAGLAAHHAAQNERAERLLAYARLSLEIARRTGEAECVVQAAAAAERAAGLTQRRSVIAAARLVQAAAALAGGALFADPKAADAAQAWVAAPEIAATASLAPEAMAVCARIQSARALAAADLDKAAEAAGVFDAAVEQLDARARASGEGKAEAALLRCDRAEFLIGFGARLKNRTLLAQAQADLGQLVDRIDPDYLPLTWARAEALRGQALAALGDLTGEARTLAESVRALAAASRQADFAYSPLDRSRIGHALGLSLQALAEACDDDGFYDHAVAAYDQSLAGLMATPSLPLRALVIHDRAGCLARRAERIGDLLALDQAEAAFKSELVRRSASADPVAWAVTQLALVRVYEARAALSGRAVSPRGADLALNEALEVFTERGLKALGDLAVDALARLRERPRTGR